MIKLFRKIRQQLLSENKEDLNTFNSNIANLEKGIETIENLSAALNTANIEDKN